MKKKRRKKNMDKATSQRWHAKWAIKDRYGLFCNRYVYFTIVDKIKCGNSESLVRQSNTRKLHKVYIDPGDSQVVVPLENDGTLKLYVVYDSSRGELVTALPWYETDEELLLDYEQNHYYERD